MITKELIERFLRNECSQSERQAVLEYFRKYPGVWDEVLGEAGWDGYEALADHSEEEANELYVSIKVRTVDKRVRRRVRMRWLSAGAAAAVLVIVAGWLLRGKATVEAGRVMASSPEAASVEASGWQHAVNDGGDSLRLDLPDGSVVELGMRSRVDFLMTDKRMVYLTGRASFKVAKDKARPFIVYSGDIGTTVLGTYFTVDAFPEASELRVALHEGRVVVRAAEKAVHKLAKEEYLFPGDVLVYRKNNGLAFVTRAVRENNIMVTATPSSGEGNVSRPDWYQFDGQSLPALLDQLSAYYRVRISYYPAQLSNHYFTGRVEKTDSLDNILQDIALLHHLTIRKDGDSSYIITNKSH